MRPITRAFLAVSFSLTLFAAAPASAKPDDSPGQSGEDHGKSGEDHGNGNGNAAEPCDPAGADASAIAAVRADAASQCDCSAATNHGRHVACVMRVANGAVRSGDLPASCRDQVVGCAVRSACGKEGFVACCRTFASGRTRCSVRRNAESCRAPNGGSACVSSQPTCCDACGPGGGCPGGGTTTTQTQPPTTITTATTSSSTTTTTGGAVCNNGLVEPPEQCDPPGSFTCPPSSPGGALLECQPGCVCPGAPTTTSTTSPTTSTTETTATTTTATTTTGTGPTTTETTGSSTTVTTSTTATTTSETATTLPETTTTATSSTTTTTMIGCDCCSALPVLLSFQTTSSGCGTDPPGSVTPARCVQGTNNGTACTSDAQCTGSGSQSCRGHLDCTGLYFGGGLPSGINLPGTVPDLGLSYSKIASCNGDTVNLTATTAGDVPGPGCPTPAGTPTYGERHCTSAGCYFGAPLALPNPGNTATGTCVHNVISSAAGAGTGTGTCSTGATNSLNLPLDSKIYLTGSLAPVAVCATCMGGTPGVCGSGTCSGGTRNGLECTPETNALNAAYPTSHDCPPPNAPATSTCGTPSQTFIGCLPIAFNLTTGTQTLTAVDPNGAADPGQGHDRVFCGFCFDNTATFAYEKPPHGCSADSECTTGTFTQCRQHSDGAFRNIFATTITETGSPANACLADGMPHNSTLVSIFCIPPSYDGIVDPSGELPGPGAVSLPGVARVIIP